MINKVKIGSLELGGETKFFRFEEDDDFRIAFAIMFETGKERDILSDDVDAVAIRISSENPEEAIKQVEEFRKLCMKPLIIYTPDNPSTDHIIIDAVARKFPNEGFLFCSATAKNNAADIARSAQKYGHNVSAYTTLDPGGAISLNKDLLKAGLSPDRIIIDPLTSLIGYGVEYTISSMERIRLDALATDETLRMPMLADMSSVTKIRESTSKEKQVYWEELTGAAVLAAGADLLLFKNIEALKKVRQLADKLGGVR